MGAVKIERSVLLSLESSIGHKGVREDDELALELFQERKRTMRLKRTKYKIRTGNSFLLDYTMAELVLPVFDKISSQYEIELVPHASTLNFDQRSRYLIRSLENVPFRLNGVYCFEAFLERGDVVEIGLNRLQFLRPNAHLNLSKEEDRLPSEIIQSKLNIMLEGETGTGKTTMARNIHESSGRAGRFIHLNLASFSSSLIESELFGHVKGAFTGAITEKRGAILEANKGTLFLDEIDSLSLELQTKLLLFLDHHEVRAVGGSTFQKADVRLIFASGTRMKVLLEKEKMRRDFYYRLTSGVLITLPSLRERPQKIDEVCFEFENKHGAIISSEARHFYKQCPWPGNLRQLSSHLNKKMVLANGKKIVLDKSDHDLLGERPLIKETEVHGLMPLENIKMDYCHQVFLKADSNVLRASKILDISPNTLKAMLSNRKNLRSNKIIDIDL